MRFADPSVFNCRISAALAPFQSRLALIAAHSRASGACQEARRAALEALLKIAFPDLKCTDVHKPPQEADLQTPCTICVLQKSFLRRDAGETAAVSHDSTGRCRPLPHHRRPAVLGVSQARTAVSHLARAVSVRVTHRKPVELGHFANYQDEISTELDSRRLRCFGSLQTLSISTSASEGSRLWLRRSC